MGPGRGGDSLRPGRIHTGIITVTDDHHDDSDAGVLMAPWAFNVTVAAAQAAARFSHGHRD